MHVMQSDSMLINNNETRTQETLNTA